MDNDSDVLKTLRYMAFERAFGELNAALSTFWKDDSYAEYKVLIEKFIQDIKDIT